MGFHGVSVNIVQSISGKFFLSKCTVILNEDHYIFIKMPGKEVLHGENLSTNGTSETFLFTSESVGEGHPGNTLNEKIVFSVLNTNKKFIHVFQFR